MAQFTMGGDEKPQHNHIKEKNNQNAENIVGYSEEEKKDADKIKVSVLDKETPIIVLFGPPEGGKTMTLIRMSAYLKSIGYTVAPVRSFRPSHDNDYKEKCDGFDSMVTAPEAAPSTPFLAFMLVKVSFNGKPVCQILEAPGEHYFSTRTPNSPFPAYINNIINSRNRKIWTILLEPDNTSKVMTQQMRELYVSKIHKLKSRMTSQDRVVFVLNKIDATEFVIGPGVIHTQLARQTTEQWYPGIFIPFMNQNPVTKLVRPDNFDFVPFQTGDYTGSYERSHEAYPEKLWNVILKRIKG